jgi:hypothetical protein
MSNLYLRRYWMALNDALEREVATIPTSSTEIAKDVADLEERLKNVPEGDKSLKQARETAKFPNPIVDRVAEFQDRKENTFPISFELVQGEKLISRHSVRNTAEMTEVIEACERVYGAVEALFQYEPLFVVGSDGRIALVRAESFRQAAERGAKALGVKMREDQGVFWLGGNPLWSRATVLPANVGEVYRVN